MRGKYTFKELITPEEAVSMSKRLTAQEMRIVANLQDAFRKLPKMSTDYRFEFLRLLSFVYGTGRVQGIRGERARRKIKNE